MKYNLVTKITSEENDNVKLNIKKLETVIQQLSPKCQQIILLNKRDGLKYKEIALKMDISFKTVKSQMRIVFKKIRETFKADEFVFFLSFL